MIVSKTAKGTKVWLDFIPGCGSNAGGWYVQVRIDPAGDPHDRLNIRPGDCDCSDWDEVERVAKERAGEITLY